MSKPWLHWSAPNDGHAEAPVNSISQETKERERWKENYSKDNGWLTGAERVKKIWG